MIGEIKISGQQEAYFVICRYNHAPAGSESMKAKCSDGTWLQVATYSNNVPIFFEDSESAEKYLEELKMTGAVDGYVKRGSATSAREILEGIK